MRMKKLILWLAASALVATSAQAATLAPSVVAGWDFSQYLSGGSFLSTDGATLQNTLAANYSNLDPTFNAGAESAAFGTLFFDGSNGSTPVPLDFATAGTEVIRPVAGSLISNKNGILPNPFDSLTILTSEGQANASLTSMKAFGALDVVFEADLSVVPAQGSGWNLDLGALAVPQIAGTSITRALDVSISTDGVTYTPVTSLSVNQVDTKYSVSLTNTQLDRLFVKLGLNADTQFDNVGISATLATVPEPGALAMLGIGLLGLARFGRYRGA